MPRPIIKDEFTALAVSRQRKAQLRRQRDGACMICGKPRNLYAHHCDACWEKHRAIQNARRGLGRWEPGKPGPMPRDFKP